MINLHEMYYTLEVSHASLTPDDLKRIKKLCVLHGLKHTDYDAAFAACSQIADDPAVDYVDVIFVERTRSHRRFGRGHIKRSKRRG